MKTKLYALAVLALLTCGLCLALPSVRHAASELLTAAFGSPTHLSLKEPAAFQPVVEALAGNALLLDTSAPVIHKSIPGVSLSVTPQPGCAGDLINGLTTSDSNLTCGVRIDWSVDPGIINQHPTLGVRLVRYAQGPGTAERMHLLTVKDNFGSVFKQLSPLGLSDTWRKYIYVIEVGNGGLSNELARVDLQVFEHADPAFPFAPQVVSQCFSGGNTPYATPLQVMPVRKWQFGYGNNTARTGEFMHWETRKLGETAPVEVRGTWYGFTRTSLGNVPAGSPVWLQTLWKTPDGNKEIIASLRMYRFNPDVGTRTAGEKVGVIKTRFYMPEFPFQLNVSSPPRIYSGAVADVEISLDAPEFMQGGDPLYISNCLASSTVEEFADRAPEKSASSITPKAIGFNNAGKISTAHNGVWSHLNGFADDVVFTSFVDPAAPYLQEIQSLRLWESKLRVGSEMPKPVWYASQGGIVSGPLVSANAIQKLTNSMDGRLDPIVCPVGRLARTFQNVTAANGAVLAAGHGVSGSNTATGIAYEVDASCSNSSAWIRPSIANGEQTNVVPQDQGVLYPATPASIVWAQFNRMNTTVSEQPSSNEVKLVVNEQICRLSRFATSCAFNVGWIGLYKLSDGNPVYELKRRLVGSTVPGDLVTVGASLIFTPAPNSNLNQISSGDRFDGGSGISTPGRYQYEMWETVAGVSRIIGKSEEVHVFRANTNSQSLDTQLKCKANQSPEVCSCAQGANPLPPNYCVSGGAAPTIYAQADAEFEFSFVPSLGITFGLEHSVNPGCPVSLQATNDVINDGRRTITLRACTPSPAGTTANVRYAVSGTGSQSVLPQPNPGFLVVVSAGPAAPTQISAISTGGLGYRVDWNHPGGAGTIYEVDLSGDSQQSWQQAGRNLTATTLSGAVNANGSYFFRVRACQSSVCSPWAATTVPLALASATNSITVALTAPTAGASFPAPATISLVATATPIINIQRVEFYRGTILAGTALNPITNTNTYSASDLNVQANERPYTYTARAYDTANPQNVVVSAGVAVTVTGPIASNLTSEPALTSALAQKPTTAELTASDAVGGTSGTFSVSESGHAQYSIPILVSPGAGKMQPSVSLNYSSEDSQDGYLGVGWSLGSGSSISVCRKTFEAGDFALTDAASYVGSEPYTFGTTSPVCLDGQRLLKLSTNACPVFETRTASAEYRTEIDSMVQICEYADGSGTRASRFFITRGKDGSRKVYGFNPGVSGDNDRHNSRAYFANGQVMVWMLARQSDVVGNYIDHSYEKTCFDGTQAGCFGALASSGSEIVAKSVSYTGFLSQAPFASVVFDYEARAPIVRVASGQKTQLSRRLTGVRSIDSGNELRRYSLTYIQPPLDSSSARKRIAEIKECRGIVCYRPLTFDWTFASNKVRTLANSVTTDRPGQDFQHLMAKRFGDINGDGLTDMAFYSSRNSNLTIALGTPQNGYFLGDKYSSGITSPKVKQRNSDRWTLADFNADGRDDLIALQSNQAQTSWFWSIHLSINGADNRPYFSATPVQGINLQAKDENDSVAVLDVNGDSLVDLLTTGPGAVAGTRVLNISFGSQIGVASGQPYAFSTPYTVNFVNAPVGYEVALGSEGLLRDFVPVDMDADGRSDLRATLTFQTLPAVTTCPTTLGRASNPLAIRGITEPLEYQCVDHAFFAFKGKSTLAPGQVDFTYISALGQPVRRLLASDKAKALIYGDINSDGYTDALVSETRSSGVWKIFFNNGAGFTESGNITLPLALNSNGQPLQNEDFQAALIDMTGDGNADIAYRQRIPGGDAKAFRNMVVPANESGTGFDLSLQYPLGGGNDRIGDGDVYLTDFIDLDNDARIDVLQLRIEDADNDKGWRVYLNERPNTPADVITTITTGLGARTDITYKPMTDRLVYQRGQRVDPATYGRGSSVIDIYAPMYVVSDARSEAPALNEPNAQSSIQYFYKGLRAQGGGRGMLGFAEVRSCDLADGIITATEYEQRFPLTGTPKRTRTWVYGSEQVQSGTANMPAQKCSVDLANSSEFRLVSDGAEQWQALPSTLAPGAAAPIFVSQLWSEQTESVIGANDTTLALDAPKKVSRTLSTNTYQGAAYSAGDPRRGNLLSTITSAYSCSANVCTTLLSTSISSNVYADDSDASWISAWLPGRLTSSTIKRCRGADASNCAAATAGTDTVNVRRASSMYYGPTSSWPGMLRTQLARANGSAANQRLSIATVYDARGNPTLTLSCGGGIDCDPEDAEAGIAAGFKMRRSDTSQIFRYSRMSYDALGRYQVSTTSPFYTGAALGSLDSIERATSVGNRDAYGNPRLASDLNGGVVRTEFGSMGRQHMSIANNGQIGYTLYTWCEGTTVCPDGAVYRVKNFSAGLASDPSAQPTPKSWEYFDKLGRSMLSIKEGFATGEYVASAVDYDHKARAIQATEPYFVPNPESASASFTGAAYTTSTIYDQFGRAWLSITPNNTARTRTSYGVVAIGGVDMMSSSMQVCPGSFSSFTNNCSETNQQRRTEFTNALGELVAVDDIDSFRLTYTHNAAGEVRKISRSGVNNGNLTGISIVNEVQFDNFGRKIRLIDPDKGTISYQYNAADELISQTDAKGQVQSQLYDARGRMWFRKDIKADGSCEGSSVWTFDQAVNGIGAAARETSLPGTACDAVTAEASTTYLKRRTSTFDSLGRPYSTTTDIPVSGKTWIEVGTFDKFGRPLHAQDATGKATITSYTSRGFLLALSDAQNAPSGEEYYRVLAMNARFQVIAEQRAGKATMVTTRGYEDSTGRLTDIKSGSGETVSDNNGAIQNESYQWDPYGNLIERTHRAGSIGLLSRNYVETFEYDAFNRLKSVLKDGVQTQAIDYNQVGNILAKAANDAGLALPINKYDYFGNAGAAPITHVNALCEAGTARAGPHAVAAAYGNSYCYDASGNVVKNGRPADKGGSSDYRTIEYSTFDMSTEMRNYRNGVLVGAVSFKYGADRSRYMRIDASPAAAGLPSENETTFYVGGVEFLTNRNTARRSIGGVLTAYQAGSNFSLNGERVYQFMDHLGSIEVLTDQNANVSGANSFDAWGERRQYNGVAMDVLAQLSANTEKTRRGFTGHEQVDRAGIIHMNGRIYDAKLGRFLQADPMVEDAKDSQGLNRYSYVLNNPLSLTDPSGYLASYRFRKAFGKVVQVINTVLSLVSPAWGVVVASISAYANGFVQTGSLRGALRAGLTHDVISMIPGFNVGTGGPLSFVINLALNSAKSGVLEALQGGSFGHGFRSAALGAIGTGLARGAIGAMERAGQERVAAGSGGDSDSAGNAQGDPYALPEKCLSPEWASKTADAAGATSTVGFRPYVSPAINVLDIGNLTIINGTITVGTVGWFQGDLRDSVVAESNVVFGNNSNWGEIDGRTFISNIAFVAVEGSGMVNVGRMSMKKWQSFKNNSCRLAGAWTDMANQQILYHPSSLSAINTSEFTGAHEMGHFLGYKHVPKYIGFSTPWMPARYPSYMGYGIRSRSPQDIRNLANAYR